MAFSDIIEKIRTDAADDSARILRASSEEEARIGRETDSAMHALRADDARVTDRIIEERARHAESAARRRARRIADARRREILDSVYAGALKKLSHLPDAEYTRFVSACAGALPPGGRGAVTVPKARERQTKDALGPRGAGAAVSDAFSGGFLFSTDTAEYDFSFEAILSRTRIDTEGAVASFLFSQP